MIGIFDSGYGGLSILGAIMKALPEYSTMYFGDNAHAPYGVKTDDEIFELTKHGVQLLFERGCEIVILGCNTASASALRRLQQEWLPVAWPDKKLLGIIVPTAESVGSMGHSIVGVLATGHTIATRVYEKEIQKINTSIKVVQHACNSLAGMIESLGVGSDEVKKEADGCVGNLFSTTQPNLDAVLLGCTHYEFIADYIQAKLPAHTKLIRQPDIVAKSLADYLTRHPEIEQKLDREGKRTYLTTGNTEDVSKKSSDLMGQNITFEP